MYRQIIPKELHNESAVLVRLFMEVIQFSNSFIKSLWNTWEGKKSLYGAGLHPSPAHIKLDKASW